MKIAFVKPPVGGILGLEMLTFVEPLGPICVAACLEAEGHECKVFDLRIDGEEHGLDLCKRFAPDVVGLQCNFTTERNRTTGVGTINTELYRQQHFSDAMSFTGSIPTQLQTPTGH